MYKLTVVRERVAGYGAAQYLRTSAAVYEAFRESFERLEREEMRIVLLDNKHKVLGFNVVSVGSLTTTIVHPREVLKPIVLMNAAAVMLMHNHPSGDPGPSKEDVEITRRVRELCELIGVRMLDHIVFGDEERRYFSFSDNGML